MGEKLPFIKFFPKDWRNDIELRSCSLAARGLWLEMIAIMHQAEPYGHLLIGGRPVTEAQLAGNVGASVEEVGTLLAELQAVGVFSRTRTGVIYSRKMTRDEKARRNARENGKKGGNPNLRKTTHNPPPDNPPDKDTLKPQRFRGSEEQRFRDPPPPVSPTAARASGQERPPAETSKSKSLASAGGGAGGGSATPCSDDDQTLADEIGGILGSNAPAWAWAGIHVRRWREAGASPALIRAVAKGVRAAADASGREPPGDARYLDKPIARAMADAKRPVTEAHGRHAAGNPADALIAQSDRYRRTA